jgi:DNA-nicking Smr family endonuclease
MSMARRRTARGHPSRPGHNTRKPVFRSPFKDLKKLLSERRQSSLATPIGGPAPPEISGPSSDTETLLHQAFEGVRPIPGNRTGPIPRNPVVKATVVSEDSEVLAQLCDLIAGRGPFDITQTEEYIEGARRGIDPRLVSRLRNGDFALQAHVDLHGMCQADAKLALGEFITDCACQGLRTVLVVHGRGRGSPQGQPVLKQATAQWLSRSALRAYVLAFTTARPPDGGAGAMYVLLRRERKRGVFDVWQGAKRRH